jgi:hypothetical protein
VAAQLSTQPALGVVVDDQRRALDLTCRSLEQRLAIDYEILAEPPAGEGSSVFRMCHDHLAPLRSGG